MYAMKTKNLRNDGSHEPLKPAVSPPPDLLTIAQLMEMLHVSRATINRILQRGELRSLRLSGRLRRVVLTDLLDWLSRHRGEDGAL